MQHKIIKWGRTDLGYPIAKVGPVTLLAWTIDGSKWWWRATADSGTKCNGDLVQRTGEGTSSTDCMRSAELAMPNVLAAHWAIKGVTPAAPRRTRAELREAVLKVLTDPTTETWTNLQVAEAVGCSDHYVGTIRVASGTRIGKDGKSYPGNRARARLS